MKKFIVALLFLTFAVSAFASTVSLQWDANTDSNLAGYRVYYDTQPTPPFKIMLPIAKGTTTVTIPALDPSKAYYFAVTAYNTAAMESVYSNIVWTPAFPTPPTNVRAISILISP